MSASRAPVLQVLDSIRHSGKVAKVRNRPTHFTEADTKATNTVLNLDLQIALKVVHLLSQTLELVQQLGELVLAPEHFVQPGNLFLPGSRACCVDNE